MKFCTKKCKHGISTWNEHSTVSRLPKVPHRTIFHPRGDSHMNRKRQIHDGIAGGLITLGVLLGVYVNPAWLWLPGILGVTLLQSGFTGFCPVYYILDQTCPEK